MKNISFFCPGTIRVRQKKPIAENFYLAKALYTSLLETPKGGNLQKVFSFFCPIPQKQ